MKMLIVATALIGGALLGGGAQALTLTNSDAQVYTVTVVTDDGEAAFDIAPSETRENLCEEGCVLSLGDGEGYEFEGDETVAIVEGAFSAVE